jgi:hypothetical protein
LDDNCNNQVDEGLLAFFFVDADNDGFGDPAAGIVACFALQGYVSDSSDCNDNDALVSRGPLKAAMVSTITVTTKQMKAFNLLFMLIQTMTDLEILQHSQ